jgi:hypothetical protein
MASIYDKALKRRDYSGVTDKEREIEGKVAEVGSGLGSGVSTPGASFLSRLGHSSDKKNSRL